MDSVRFHKDGTATVRSGEWYYLVEKPKVRVKIRTRYARGHAFREVVRYLVGRGTVCNLGERAHQAMKNAGQTFVKHLTVLLEVLTMQNVLDMIHKALYVILPDQFVFRLKIGRFFDVGLGGWAGATA